MAIEAPHFSFPFRMTSAGTRAVVTEQDSESEILDCTEVLLSTELGERLDLPDYGIPDQTFRENGVDRYTISEAIRLHEDRAMAVVDAFKIDDMIQKVSVSMGQGA